MTANKKKTKNKKTKKRIKNEKDKKIYININQNNDANQKNY